MNLVFNSPLQEFFLISVIGPRIAAEKETIRAMLSIFCMEKHGSERGSLCGSCEELLGYAEARLERCPFGEGKPTCRRCRVHCYEAGHRQKIRAVMGYAGPRMIYTHPLMAFKHATSELWGRA